MFYKVFVPLLLVICGANAQRNIHERLEQQLEYFVAPNGLVNYKEWQKEQHALRAYLQALEDHSPQTYWTTANRKAYWINAFNAATIAKVLEHYPLQSVKDIDLFRDTVVFKINNQSMGLKSIENKLREMKDPRIHFALHRAAVSSPDLSRKVYRSNTLEDQLEEATIKFLKDPDKNKFQEDIGRLSQLFQWYCEDFGPPNGRLAFLQKYACSAIGEKTKFQYLTFDWRLNEGL
jgi:hypothetical protein